MVNEELVFGSNLESHIDRGRGERERERERERDSLLIYNYKELLGLYNT